MNGVQFVITGDLTTGSVQIQGPIGDMRVVHWMLGEARRVCERMANDRDKAAANGGPQIALVSGDVLDRLPNRPT